MMVEWRTIDRLPGYEVSSEAEVRRTTTVGRWPAGRLLAARSDHKGYLRVCLKVGDGKFKSLLLNRLVCEAFHGAPSRPDLQAAHRDGNKLDNRPGNLRWATPLQNTRDKYAHGTMGRGESAPHVKLSAQSVLTIREQAARRESINSIAKRHGVNRNTVYRILRQETWASVA